MSILIQFILAWKMAALMTAVAKVAIYLHLSQSLCGIYLDEIQPNTKPIDGAVGGGITNNNKQQKSTEMEMFC